MDGIQLYNTITYEASNPKVLATIINFICDNHDMEYRSNKETYVTIYIPSDYSEKEILQLKRDINRRIGL